MAIGGGVYAATWYAGWRWAASDEAQLAERELSRERPRWIDDAAPRPTAIPRSQQPPAGSQRPGVTNAGASGADARARATGAETGAARPDLVSSASRADAADRLIPPTSVDGLTAEARGVGQPSTWPSGSADATGPGAARTNGDARTSIELADADAPAETAASDETPVAAASPHASVGEIELAEAGFRFLDPPEPGAQAIIAVLVRNHADLPTGPLRLLAPSRWFKGFDVVGAEPPLLDDRVGRDGLRVFDLPSVEPGDDTTFEIQLAATDDLVDPPDLRLTLADGDEIGRARPQTESPRPHPGPARAIEISRIGLRAAVVPTAWEPPAFVVGQIRGTANLTEGNTVLIGHLTGLAGDVFAHLDQLEPGDEVTAVSRGMEYPFVVSEVAILPNDDSSPLDPTDDPRLTMMTCAGTWDPIAHDYSHRLWVLAEPPELAAATIASGIRRLQHDPTVASGEDTVRDRAAADAAGYLGPSPKEVWRSPAGRHLPGSVPATDAIHAGEAGEDPDGGVADVPDTSQEPAGMEIVAPTDGESVERRLTVQGRRTADASPDAAHVWLAVRAQVEGSRWYFYPRELDLDADGRWSADLELGGPAGINHELRVAAVDAATDATLRRQLTEHPSEPLATLPDGFRRFARIVVTRR
ncbi:MAG: sortase [Chloroflexi bacterium]|nr:sortase [Chloroflexota bacterium]